MAYSILQVTAIVALVTGVAVAVRVYRTGRRRPIRPERIAVQTWEGEGGNIVLEKPAPEATGVT
jgi:hypothetical protein